MLWSVTQPPAGRPRARVRAAGLTAALLAAALLAAGCGLLPSSHASQAGARSGGTAASRSASGTPSPRAAAASSASAAPACPAVPRRFSCQLRARIARVKRFLRTRPGITGVVLTDRATGAVWRNRYAATPVYMASTSKLAMAVTLLLQNRAGVIHLTSADMATMHQMLHVSSDTAADDLWFKFGASFYTGFFGRIGLTSPVYFHQPGVTGPYWGEMACPAEELSRVVNYVLDDLPAPLRGYLAGELRHVATDQHFGVWGAGPASRPGNKDGWSVEKPGWIINSAGFAGPGARYTLVMMNSLRGQGNYRDGTDTVTQIAAMLLRGHPVPAPTLRATP